MYKTILIAGMLGQIPTLALSAETVARLSEDECKDLVTPPYGGSPIYCATIHNLATEVSGHPIDLSAFKAANSFSVYTTTDIDALVQNERQRADQLQQEVRILREMVREMATTQDQTQKQINSFKLGSADQ